VRKVVMFSIVLLLYPKNVLANANCVIFSKSCFCRSVSHNSLMCCLSKFFSLACKGINTTEPTTSFLLIYLFMHVSFIHCFFRFSLQLKICFFHDFFHCTLQVYILSGLPLQKTLLFQSICIQSLSDICALYCFVHI